PPNFLTTTHTDHPPLPWTILGRWWTWPNGREGGAGKYGSRGGGGAHNYHRGDVLPTMLSTDEVLRIHDRVCADFGTTADPIAPAGVRDPKLLESAVARQRVGFGPFLKYSDPFDNAATLTFGVCCNHAFHNGNKRTALVSMLAHLDANKHTL